MSSQNPSREIKSFTRDLSPVRKNNTENISMTIKIQSILKALLREHDMTAAQLARLTKIPPQTINNWLSGQEPRSLSHIKLVADYFEISVDYLIYGKEEKRKEAFKEFEDEINAGTFEVVLRRVKR